MATLVRNGPAAAIKLVYRGSSVCSAQPAVARQAAKRTSKSTDCSPFCGVARNYKASLAGLCNFSRKNVTNFPEFSRRFAHTDVRFPSFEDRRYAVDPTAPARENEDFRRSLRSCILYGAGGSLALIIGTKAAQTMIIMKNMPADQVALGTLEVKLSEICHGQCKTFLFRGKPLFVKHRTEDEIEAAKNVNLSELRDPQDDSSRVKKPEWLVLLAACPHLGCVPIPGKGEYNGFFCPCHSSSFDTSGRIRIGPAPTNLEVPPHKFITDDLLLVGAEG